MFTRKGRKVRVRAMRPIHPHLRWPFPGSHVSGTASRLPRNSSMKGVVLRALEQSSNPEWTEASDQPCTSAELHDDSQGNAADWIEPASPPVRADRNRLAQTFSGNWTIQKRLDCEQGINRYTLEKTLSFECLDRVICRLFRQSGSQAASLPEPANDFRQRVPTRLNTVDGRWVDGPAHIAGIE